jgi:hypothetical protein
MKHTGHTPGPWETVNIQGQLYVRRVGAEKGIGSVCRIIKTHDGADFAWTANARLLKDAPRLAERVEKLERFVRFALTDASGSWVAEARTLLAEVRP